MRDEITVQIERQRAAAMRRARDQVKRGNTPKKERRDQFPEGLRKMDAKNLW